MKRYMFLHYGFENPTDKIMEAWSEWFEMVGDRMIDMGGFDRGLEISGEGKRDLPFGKDSIAGYNIIEAESFEDAVSIGEANPFIRSIRIYEMRGE